MMFTVGVLILAVLFVACLVGVKHYLDVTWKHVMSQLTSQSTADYGLKRKINKLKRKVALQSTIVFSSLVLLGYLLAANSTLLEQVSSASLMSVMLMLAGLAIYFVHNVWYSVKNIIRLQYRLMGEISTEQYLNDATAAGAKVFHDVPINRGKGRVAHVVVSEQGVFAVETKAWRKEKKRNVPVAYDGLKLKFPQLVTKIPINDAVYQARTLNQYLMETTGEEVAVQPVVSLPGWSVLPLPKHPVHSACTTLNPKNFHYLLEGNILSLNQVEKITQQLSHACNDNGPISVVTPLNSKYKNTEQVFNELDHQYYNF